MPVYFNQTALKVVQFTDLHYGESEETDKQNMALQRKIISIEKPDLVVLSGDMVSGYGWDGSQNCKYVKYIQPMIETNTSWVIILGNHDTEGDLAANQIMQLDIQQPLSLTLSGYVDPTNLHYIVPIKTRSSNITAMYIAFLYSGSTTCEGKGPWGCVEKPAVEWVSSTLSTLNTSLPINVFVHIPIPEVQSLFNSNPVIGNANEGINLNSILNKGVATSSVNSGLFQVLSNYNVQGIYCGHDHDNDYYGVYNNISLFFGRKSGYGSYGPDGFLRGARVIHFNSTGNSTTYIRNIAGQIEIPTPYNTVILPVHYPPDPFLFPVGLLVGFVIISVSVFVLVSASFWHRFFSHKKATSAIV